GTASVCGGALVLLAYRGPAAHADARPAERPRLAELPIFLRRRAVLLAFPCWLVLPVPQPSVPPYLPHFAHAALAVSAVAAGALLAETHPAADLHLGLAAERARVALERVAVNVMEYEQPDNAGWRARGEPCVPGGPAAYFATLPLEAIRQALTADGIPAYVSATAGTYLCNQTLYTTLHAVRSRSRAPRVGLIHVPLLPSMVAASGLEQPSMDFPLMLRAVEIALGVIAGDLA